MELVVTIVPYFVRYERERLTNQYDSPRKYQKITVYSILCVLTGMVLSLER